MGSPVIRFERSATYMDRAVRYLIELDGKPIHPRLRPNSVAQTQVSPGPHLVRISSHRRKYFEAAVTVPDYEQIDFEVRPSHLGWLLGTPPVLIGLPAGTIVAGRTGRRKTPTSDPQPRHD
jgi:hypothetical protein